MGESPKPGYSGQNAIHTAIIRAMFRAAHPDDAVAVARILIESRSAFMPYAPSVHAPAEITAWVAQHLIPAGGVTVAESAQDLVAVLAVSEDPGTAWIDHLYVLPGFENRGLGTKLLAAAHAAIAKPIRLFTFQQNCGARRFYERHGYQVIALSDGQGNEEQCPDVLYERRPAGEARQP